MPKDWHPFAISEIKKSSRRMTPWEKDFFDSICRVVDEGRSLSEKQSARLLELHKKMTEITRISR